MLDELFICGLRRAKEVMWTGWDAVLSIADPEADTLDFGDVTPPVHRIIRFHDAVPHGKPHKVLATPDHIRAALEFGARSRVTSLPGAQHPIWQAVWDPKGRFIAFIEACM
jgi:hypothetical protein